MRAGLLQHSAAQESRWEAGASEVELAVGAVACDGALKAVTVMLGAGNAALRSPLRTRSAAGGSADLPADNASRRSIEAARPEIAPDPRACTVATVFTTGAGAGCAGAACDAAAFDGMAVTVEFAAGVALEGGSAALRSPLRTRSAAAGNADLPADSASRRSIEAARPEIAPEPVVFVAGEADMEGSDQGVSVSRRGKR